MFEETNTNNTHVDKARGRVKWVFIQAVSDGTLLTVDTANTTPGVTIGGTTGDYTIAGLPSGAFAHWVGLHVQLAEATGVGACILPEALAASAGTAAFETSTTPGTAAAPTTLSRVFITLVVGRTG